MHLYTQYNNIIIGASLSKPHIDGKYGEATMYVHQYHSYE